MHVPRPGRQRKRDAPDSAVELVHRPTLRLAPIERTFYSRSMRVDYRIEPCKSALTQVARHAVQWSLNPYMGCAHRCTFCYVRHFEQRADRPPDDRYGRSIRVKTNVAEVLRRELGANDRGGARGLPRDGHRPVSAGRGALPAHASVSGRARRGVDAVLDRHARPARRPRHRRAPAGRRRRAEVYFSLPTLDERVWRTTEPGTAPPASRLGPCAGWPRPGIAVGVGIAPILPGLSDAPEQLEAVVACRAGSRRPDDLGERRPPPAWVREHFLEALARDWPEEVERYEALFAIACVPARVGRRPPMTDPSGEARAPPTPRTLDRRADPAAEPPTARLRGLGHEKERCRVHAVESRRGRRDHLPHRRRSRGRPRRAPPRAVPLAADPRDRRGSGRRVGGRAHGAPAARRRDHGSADARHGRPRGDRAAAQRVPTTGVLIFTAYGERSLLQRGLESGARGYILKETPHETLLRAIEKVAAGETFVDPGLMAEFIAGRGQMDVLTPREREILQLLADGMSNVDVAQKLFISQETVKSHVRHILAKLEADTRTAGRRHRAARGDDRLSRRRRAGARRGADPRGAGGAAPARGAPSRRTGPAPLGDRADPRHRGRARPESQGARGKSLARALELARTTSRELRALCDDLEPRTLHELGFAAAVDTLARRIAATREVEFDLDLAHAAELGENALIALYQIVREAIDQSLRRGVEPRHDLAASARQAGGSRRLRRRAPERRSRARGARREGCDPERAFSSEVSEPRGSTIRVELPPSAARR